MLLVSNVVAISERARLALQRVSSMLSRKHRLDCIVRLRTVRREHVSDSLDFNSNLTMFRASIKEQYQLLQSLLPPFTFTATDRCFTYERGDPVSHQLD
jgi:hypothetical protein